jgi:hypothetical protein
MNTVRILVAALSLAAVTGAASAANVRYADQSDHRTAANSLVTEIPGAKPVQRSNAPAIRYADQGDRRTVANSVVIPSDGAPAAKSTTHYADFTKMRSFAN